MAGDVTDLAEALGFDRYCVFGHSFGSFVALRHAVDFPSARAGACATVVSGGAPASRWLAGVASQLATFEPEQLRAQVSASWGRERDVETDEAAAALLVDQMPFHFADPLDPRIADYAQRASQMQCSAGVLRHFARQEYGLLDVEDSLGEVDRPVLVLSGRYDRTCPPEAGEEMLRRIPDARLEIFEKSGHMFFVEEQDRFLEVMREFLADVASSA
jgi:proline iminopeptidase